MTIACMDNIANSFVSRHASDIIHSFPALTDFTWFNLTTPENLEPIIRAVLDPSNMPRLRSLHIRELGQRKRSPWGINPSVITLCKGLRTRRQEECPLIRVPRIDNVVSLRSGSDKMRYKRGAVMARGERLNELWDMLAEAQC
ncbi:hypothetical protein PENSPDRAFT_658630 [Peniophora sp. CONT]|nr:hypothetical protein PENSPDRAFT_658630 [Peniophora sp. CONT]